MWSSFATLSRFASPRLFFRLSKSRVDFFLQEAAIGNSFEPWYTQQQKPLKSSVTNDYNQTDSLPRIPPFAILFFRCNATVEESLHFAPLTTRPICVDKVHFLKLYYEKRKAISAASVKWTNSMKKTKIDLPFTGIVFASKSVNERKRNAFLVQSKFTFQIVCTQIWNWI